MEFIRSFWNRILDCIMARSCTEQERLQHSTSRDYHLPTELHGRPVRWDSHPHENVEVEVAKGPNLSEGISLMQRSTAALTTNAGKNIVHMPEDGVRNQSALIQELNTKLQEKDLSLKALQEELDRARRRSQDALQKSAKEEQRQKLIIEEKDNALKDANLHTSQWMSQCRKLEAQFAMIEKQTAQESLKSGAYPDDLANPGMLEGACKAVDKATEDLARFLYSISVTKELQLGSVELERFICQISPARSAEFSRAIQVKYVWSHWICFQLFRGFEHVFFDVGGLLTSPLDSKKHALECFRSFQQEKSLSNSDSCPLFQAFCTCKYREMFPQWLLNQCFFPNIVVANENGRFNGDEEICDHFMAVARAVWSLHELAFSFDPPASILRMASGTSFDKQFQEPVIHVEDGDGISKVVMLMVRPAFRVRKSVVRSRVFLCKK